MEPRRRSREEGREGEGREEGGERIQAFLPLDDLVLSCSLLWHCFLWKLSGPMKTHVSPQPLAVAPVQVPGIQQVLNTSLSKREMWPTLLWELSPCFLPTSLEKQKAEQVLGTRPGAP